MRYGIILEGPDLPPVDLQRAVISACRCDMVVEERSEAIGARRRVARLLFRLKRGDELCVHSLGVLGAAAAQVLTTLRGLLEVGVVVELARSPTERTRVAPDSSALDLAACLAEYEANRPAGARATPDGRQHKSQTPALTKYQVEYARKLYAEGSSLRSIGMLFRATPDEIWQVLGK